MTVAPAAYATPTFTEWPNKPASGDKLSEWHVHNYVRLLDHVGKILADLDKRRTWTPHVYTPHKMTYLKLLMCASYARTFLKVGSDYAKDLRYLDILSSSGLSYPEAGKHPVPGSCFFTPLAQQDFKAPATSPAYSFTKMWAFDSEASNLEALGWRHSQLTSTAGFGLPPVQAVGGDVNATLPALLDELGAEREALYAARKKRPLYLAFVDNEGLDVHMSTISALQTKIRADLILHIPTHGIARLIAQESATGNTQHKLNAFFGNERWREIRNEDDVARIYRENVGEHTDGEFQLLPPVHIRGKKSAFALIVLARQSKDSGDKGWVARNERLAEACGRFDVDTMDSVLERVLMGQRDLSNWP